MHNSAMTGSRADKVIAIMTQEFVQTHVRGSSVNKTLHENQKHYEVQIVQLDDKILLRCTRKLAFQNLDAIAFVVTTVFLLLAAENLDGRSYVARRLFDESRSVLDKLQSKSLSNALTLSFPFF